MFFPILLRIIKIGRERYRLPTEAEWEYAARAGTSHLYAGSDNLDEVAWYNIDSGDKTHPVGEKKSNGYGLYDMSGNVYEWCWDWYGEYTSTSHINPRGNESGSYRVRRGSSWSDNAQKIRISYRINFVPSYRYNSIGFRLVSSL
jgi:formylglycine-generating enzyme required for sulfatase activity